MKLMEKRNIGLFLILIVLVTTLTACVLSRRVVVGVSADIDGRYDIYPSIELDVAAVTSDEADQIKNAGVDGYFSPDNPLRKRLEPFTAYFDEESTAPRELHSRGDSWIKWQRKKPSKLVVIADLPHSPDMPKDDPRLIFIDIKKALFGPPPVYVEVEADKIVRVYKSPRDPQKKSKQAEE
jgi:hypothetical protein